jgi:two-component system sensor histidine kinase KdpD
MLSPLHRRSAWLEYGLAFAAFAATSLLNLWLERWIGYEAVALVYLLAVVLLALFVGRGPIVFGTALTALAWSYAFAPPRYSFHIGSFYDKIMFAMYFVVALTVAQLTARLRAEHHAEQKREERSRTLYLFTRELADAADRTDILERVVNQAGQAVNAEIALLLATPQSDGKFILFPKSTWHLADPERALAARACELNHTVGRGTQVSPQASGLYLPLSVGGGAADGVLAVRSKPGAELTLDQRSLLENFARQTALVLDRQRLRDAEVITKLLVESERFGRTLLNSVSHELRTPLAAIATAAATLRDSAGLSPFQQNLSAEIDSATARLNRVVQSLLSAARIQSGQVRPNLDWCDISDVLRVTFRELGSSVANHRIEKRIESGLPLVRADFILMQQALANLLVNAVTHTPPGTSIAVSTSRQGADLLIEVADNGPGLPAAQIERMFDLFQRAPGAKPGGTGLGLAIVKGFVEAQGGRVQAANRLEGGALFTILMPITQVPIVSEETS